jgi:hypothetical protein
MADYANYAWIIERDYTVALTEHEPRFNETTKRWEHTVPKRFAAADICGPRNAHPQALIDLKGGKGMAFQLWDDDGVRYYTGRFFETLDDLDYEGVNPNIWHETGPLGDFGEPNAGCTEMTIKNGEPYIG